MKIRKIYSTLVSIAHGFMSLFANSQKNIYSNNMNSFKAIYVPCDIFDYELDGVAVYSNINDKPGKCIAFFKIKE